MAKPVPAPAPAPEVSPDDVTTEPEIENPSSTLPTGVAMHDAGSLPYTTDRAERLAPDPTRPPPGWKGTYVCCGGCGDFLGNADRCPKCAPPVGSNIVNGGP